MKILKWLEKVEEYAAYIFFLAAIIVALFGVLMRYVFNHPVFGLEEYVEILMPWAIFIGFGRALKENHHIAVDVVYDLFPFQVKRGIAVFANLCGAGYSFFLTFGGIQMMSVAIRDNFVTSDSHIPLAIEYVILPIAMFLLGIYFLWKAYKAIVGNKGEIEGENHQEEDSYLSEDQKGGM